MENLNEVMELIAAIQPSVTDPEEIEGYEPNISEVALWRKHRVSVDAEDLQRLVAAIRRVPMLAALEGGYTINSPGSHSSIRLDSLAHWMLAQSRIHTPGHVIQILTEALRINEAPLLEIIPIWGITPQQEIDLGDGLKILPIQAIPGSRLKDIFTNIKRHRFTFEMPHLFARPGAAILKETQHGPIYLPADAEAAQPINNQIKRLLAVVMPIIQGAEAPPEAMQQLAADMGRERLEEMRQDTSIASLAEELSLVVALCIDHPIFPVGQAYQLSEDLPLVGSPAGYGGPTNDLPFNLPVDAQDYPLQEIEALVRSYFRLGQEVRRRLKTPLRRLNTGRKEILMNSVEGAALDLGISAESLLTDKVNRDVPLSFTVRARGTLLMAGTSDDKKNNYKTLKNLYALRSTVAHEGAVADHTVRPRTQKDQVRVNEAWKTIKSGESLCISMIRKIIEDGSFPEWDDLMFKW